MDRRRIVHMSGESVVAITSGDGHVRFIDMQSAQERQTALVGHAASVHCIVVQEDKKRVFTVDFIFLNKIFLFEYLYLNQIG